VEVVVAGLVLPATAGCAVLYNEFEIAEMLMELGEGVQPEPPAVGQVGRGGRGIGK
jgi:hypothetical protein